MLILSHRGYWVKEYEKNREIAFERSFSLGFGTETDIRDYKGQLVISHDIADESCITVKRFFEVYNSFKNNLPLALNIKADGLQYKLKELLLTHSIENYFVFDMAVPDGIIYLNEEINVFTRQSEYEMLPAYYKQAKGLWLDEFYDHWVDRGVIQKHMSHGKEICIVSPDLHGRDYKNEWAEYKAITDKCCSDHLMLCTDHPEKAREFFYE